MSVDCPAGWLQRTGAFNITCHESGCANTSANYDRCCGHEDQCITYRCPNGTALRPNSESLFCLGWKCAELDTDTCCYVVNTTTIKLTTTTPMRTPLPPPIPTTTNTT